MTNRDILSRSYPRYALLIYLNWLLITSMPFLGKIRSYFIIVELIMVIPFLFRKINLNTLKINIPLLIFISVVTISSLFTSSFINYYLWITILLIITAQEFIATADNKEIEKLVSGIYLSMEIIILLSFAGILLIKVTNLENSSNFTISYSLGNFIQNDRFLGVTNNYNLLGPLAALATLMSFTGINNNKGNWKKITSYSILLLINAYILIGTKSLTAIFAFCCCLAVMILCYIKKHRKIIFLALLGIGVLGIILFIVNIDFLSTLLHRDLRTASFRFTIWESCIQLIREHPIVGYGNQAAYLEAASAKDLFIHPNGTHNMYMETAVLYGIPAVCIYIISILITIFRILKNYMKNVSMEDSRILIPLIIFIFGIIQGLAEGQQLFTNSPIMIMYITAFMITNLNIKGMKNSECPVSV